jgi:predicted Zn-dependent protease
MCAVALSGLLPSIAASKARAALVAASSGSAAVRSSAQADASVASSLDPLSDAGLLAEAQIALAGGDLHGARADLLAAIKRDPEDAIPWQRLVGVEFSLHDYRATLAASRRFLQLFPAAAYGRALVQQSTVLLAPPSGSATSVQTPLPAG